MLLPAIRKSGGRAIWIRSANPSDKSFPVPIGEPDPRFEYMISIKGNAATLHVSLITRPECQWKLMSPLNDFEGLERLLENTSSRNKSRLPLPELSAEIELFVRENYPRVSFYDDRSRKCPSEFEDGRIREAQRGSMSLRPLISAKN